jgi:2-keto-4-pentenoate hydratase
LTGEDAIAPDEAYLIQGLVTAYRLGRGERIVGWKLGYTSAVMREQMGIADPNFGPLTDAMLLFESTSAPYEAMVPREVIQPKVEPEIALVLDCDVTEALPPDRIGEHVREARAALEVVDSIWLDYRFSWADNTADGSSAAYVVMGPVLPLEGLADVQVELSRNGVSTGSGRGSAAMGDPLIALSWLSMRLAEQGTPLREGDVVITGGLCGAIDLRPGDEVRGTFDERASVSVRREPSMREEPSDDGSLEP